MDHRLGIRYSRYDKVLASQLAEQGDFTDEMIAEMREMDLRAEQHGIQWMMRGETEYHYKLGTIVSQPSIIYYMGDIDLLHQPMLAIVGPRVHSAYAQQVVTSLVTELSGRGVVTISGLAPGIDQLAHRLSLKQHIPTIAVLGWGFRHYLEHPDRQLIQQIVDAWGLVISEFKLWSEPQQYTFPQRNRIIAGLADVVFVPEAQKWSGSLITVDFALKMHKPVYGTPQDIFSPGGAGLHELMSQSKVKIVHNIPEFLEKFFVRRSPAPQNIPLLLSPSEQHIRTHIQTQGPSSLDSLLAQDLLSPADTLTSLTLLEMAQYIYQSSPWVYALMT